MEKGKELDIFQIHTNVLMLFAEFNKAFSRNTVKTSSKWSPPPTGWLKINTDVCLKDSNSVTSVIVRNEKGEVVLAFAEHMNLRALR